MIFSSGPLLKNTLIKSVVLLSSSLLLAIILGITLSNLNNLDSIDTLLETKQAALPSILLDRNGEVITEYYSDEKRDLVTLDIIPEYLLQGLILWEDESFYHHKGFNLWAIFRAALNNMIGRAVSGASTLTQQLSRTLFLSNKFSMIRKIKELWIAIQLEKKFTKNEILTLYLNHVPLGFGTNGIGAASRFYFDKSVQEISYAEAASLITLLSNPSKYSFIKFPKNHKKKQKEVLKRMVKAGVITSLESEKSFNEFWLKWQSSAQTSRGAFFNREDEAPFFSDWVMTKISKELPNVNIFRDGLVIHSTLDLKWNKLAEKMLVDVLERQQQIFEAEQMKTYNIVQDYFIDAVALMGEVFSLTNVSIDKNRDIKRCITDYNKDINPALNLTSQILGLNLVDTVTEMMFDKDQTTKDLLSQVQGAFIVLDNETGQIITMIGGKKFDPNHRFNYAMQSSRQPGSSFKPFVYSAALDTKTFTAGSIIMDSPYVFTFDSEDPDDWYTPFNYGARFSGKVNVRKALRRSLNIPACKVFYTIGFNNEYKVPIDRAALLLGITSQSEIDRRFKPEISTALGTGSVAPIEMAAAFSVFANMGQKKIPNTILYIEDREGKIIYNPWKELQKYYRENNKKLQIISKENAYVITSILKESISSPDGTLAFVKARSVNDGKEFAPVAMAAKTGTTQNWSDAWVIGYSPAITAAGWVGFNKYGLSLGYEQPGARVVGPTWMEYMRQYHENMEELDFQMPDRVAAVQICRSSGKLPSKNCDPSDLYVEYFLPGTVPTTTCPVCERGNIRTNKNMEIITDRYEKNFLDSTIQRTLYDSKVNVDTSILNQFRSNNEKLDIDDQLIKVDLFDDSSLSIDDIDLNLTDTAPKETEDTSIDVTDNPTEPTSDIANEQGIQEESIDDSNANTDNLE